MTGLKDNSFIPTVQMRRNERTVRAYEYMLMKRAERAELELMGAYITDKQ